MSEKTIILLLINTLIFIGILRLVFRSFKVIKKCFFYLIKPDIVSIIDNSYNKDFKYTNRFLFVIILMIAIGVIEFVLFYH
jgi:hypothetical protein